MNSGHIPAPQPGWLLLVALTVIPIGRAGAESREIDFNRDIRPILSAHCFKCHGFDASARQAGLRLDTQEGLTAQRSSGDRVVVAGDPAQSQLIARVTSKDESFRMPPADVADQLNQRQQALLNRWIEKGAQWKEHWSFIPPNRPPLPNVQNASWPIHSIDDFVLARLESAGIPPSIAAERHTLLRRVSLDLTGLPPTLSEIEAYLGDTATGAYERVVDRLLASPHYGERMARRWLDLARYADSSGYANDRLRSMWPYRDWVITALNDDMPFDQFTIEQLAGDMLPGAGRSQLVASGFHRNTPHQYEGGSDPEQYRVERVKNRVDTTGTVWLGLTVTCAQCHTHKYDPLSQREYYQLFAFFNSASETQKALPSESQSRELVKLDGEIAECEAQLAEVDQSDWPPDMTARLEKLTKLCKELQESFPTTLVFNETDLPRETFIQVRGDFLSLGDKVMPVTPAWLHPFESPANGPASRLDFARWLMHEDNPLTARVTVNRAWQHFFGRGLVETENDFGHQGSLPTHPELLDWLARELIESGWRLKHLHRLIVTSATYRQSSQFRPDLVDQDPRNLLLARQSRHRVEAEVIRDLALATSGLLSRKIGGPVVFPPISPNAMQQDVGRDVNQKHDWPTSEGADRYRRGLYTAIYRSNVHPMLSTFDGPDRDNACTRRSRSNTPLQSLSLSNAPAMIELFRGLAARIVAELPEDDILRMSGAFRICLGRDPTPLELAHLLEFYREQRVNYETNTSAAEQLLPQGVPTDTSITDTAAWVTVSRLLMNLDEFVTRE